MIPPGAFATIARDENFTFSKYTTYGAGGGARCAYFPKNFVELRALIEYAVKHNINYFVLGDGSNVLASEEQFDGWVICTRNLRGIIRIKEDKIFCLCGTSLSSLMNYCKEHGFGGLEYLAGIPASVGGAAFMNAGAGGVYIQKNISAVKIFDGKTRNLSKTACEFGYKHSTMRDIKCAILGVFLSVNRQNPAIVSKNIKERLAARSRLPNGRSCGCVFKNIPLPNAELSHFLEKLYGDKGGFVPESMCSAGFLDGKFYSAGRLIDECGLGGLGGSRCFVSPVHCNFIINNGAGSDEVYDLIMRVKHLVKQKSGVCLTEEVVFVGHFD